MAFFRIIFEMCACRPTISSFNTGTLAGKRLEKTLNNQSSKNVLVNIFGGTGGQVLKTLKALESKLFL